MPRMIPVSFRGLRPGQDERERRPSRRRRRGSRGGVSQAADHRLAQVLAAIPVVLLNRPTVSRGPSRRLNEGGTDRILTLYQWPARGALPRRERSCGRALLANTVDRLALSTVAAARGLATPATPAVWVSASASDIYRIYASLADLTAGPRLFPTARCWRPTTTASISTRLGGRPLVEGG